MQVKQRTPVAQLTESSKQARGQQRCNPQRALWGLTSYIFAVLISHHGPLKITSSHPRMANVNNTQ